MMLRKLNISFLIFAVCLLSVTVTNAQQSKNDKNYRDMIAEYNSGNKTKAYDIALSYKYAWNEAPKNVSKAIEWLDKAFDAGIYKSATMIGTIYRTADGVNLDYSKAEKYYKKAAAKGDEAAMIRLGQMYYYGSGVKENYATAKKWYYEAAKKYADSKTKCSLACVFYADMNFYTSSNFKANYPEALKWYEKAFRAGYTTTSNDRRWSVLPVCR